METNTISYSLHSACWRMVMMLLKELHLIVRQLKYCIIVYTCHVLFIEPAFQNWKVCVTLWNVLGFCSVRIAAQTQNSLQQNGYTMCENYYPTKYILSLLRQGWNLWESKYVPFFSHVWCRFCSQRWKNHLQIWWMIWSVQFCQSSRPLTWPRYLM